MFACTLVLTIKAQAKDELIVALNHYPPWQISDTESPEGIDIEIIEAIAKRLSLKVRYAKCPGPRCFAMMRDGYADIITGLFKTSERMAYMDYIEPAYTRSPPKVFYVKAEGGPSITSYEDLQKLNHIGVAAQTSYFPRFDTDKTLQKLEVVHTKQLLRLLNAGRIDTFVSTETQADYLIITEGFQGVFKKAAFSYGSDQQSYLALSKKSPHAAKIDLFNKIVQDMVRAGEIAKLEAGYFQALADKHAHSEKRDTIQAHKKPSALPLVTIYTESFPPYNMRAENGTITGEATQLVRQIMDKSGLKYDIKLGPWTRALRNATTTDNSLIYSIARVPARDQLFDWLVPLLQEQYYLIGRKNDRRILTPTTIANGQFTAICMTEDISCWLLRSAGFPEKSIIRFASAGGVTSAAAMMFSGRADFYPDTLYRYKHVFEGSSFDTDMVHPKVFLGQLDFYLAAGKHLNPIIREQVIEAYDLAVKTDGFRPLN